MADSRQTTPRKPATKFPQLQKKLLKTTAGDSGKRTTGIHHAQRGHQQRHS